MDPDPRLSRPLGAHRRQARMETADRTGSGTSLPRVTSTNGDFTASPNAIRPSVRATANER